MERLKFDPTQIAFPLVSMEMNRSGCFALWGTAFYLGEGIFATAKHVVEAAEGSLANTSAEALGISMLRQLESSPNEWISYTFTEFEKHSVLDLALFKLEDEFRHANKLEWVKPSIDFLSDVYSCGYPYALDIEHKVMNVRCIKGHVMGTGVNLFPGEAFQCYELSFSAPRGLSGAPLLINQPIPSICGMIVGNRSHEMEVESSTEIEDNGNVNTYTKIEVMHMGVAIQSGVLLETSFDIIGGKISEYISKKTNNGCI